MHNDILQNARSSFVIITEDGLLIDINKSAEKLLGLKKKDVINTYIGDYLADDSKLKKSLSMWSRTNIVLPLALKFESDDLNQDIKIYGSLVEKRTAEKPATILLECESKTKSNQNFSTLTSKIDLLNKEILKRKKAEDNLSGLIKATSTSMGGEFFRNFAVNLSHSMDVSQVVICEQNNQTARVLANCVNGEIISINCTRSCKNSFTDDENKQPSPYYDFSDALEIKELEVFRNYNNNYIYCFPLIAEGSTLVGSLYIANHKKIESLDKTLEFLKPFSERAAVEISRMRAENALEDAKNKLEQRVIERTAELEVALRESHQATRSKSAFLANMSHEIRTPMNGVLGMLSLLNDTPLNEEQIDLINTAYNSAETLLTILNDILDLSKIEAGKLDLELIDFDIRHVIEDSVTLFATNAHAKKLEILCDIDDSFPSFVAGDPTRTRQILANLIGNAIKFTEKGEVAVKTKLIQKTNKNVTVELCVSDTGIGISEEAKSRIFESFSQADGSTTRVFGGTGLGLTICQQLIEIMGGELRVESEEGKGSQFIFNLQFNVSDIEAKQPDQESDIDAENLNVLLVDDNLTNLKILLNYLKSWGIKADAVNSGEEAIKRLEVNQGKDQQYNLIITDMMMPKMNGLQLSQFIKSNSKYQDIEIILLTSVATDVRSAAEKIGIAGVLNKPVRQSLLHSVILSETQSIKPVQLKERETNSVFNASQLEKKSILVVEDNLINQKVVKGLLKKFNMDVKLAENGQEALKLLSNNHFDLIFMDCQMPIMDGYEATAHIRSSSEWFREITIVAMTANAMSGDKEVCIKAGMDGYISKPLKPAELNECLHIWLDSDSDKVDTKLVG